jgi:phosphoglycerate dehydrogenase-like enzyme
LPCRTEDDAGTHDGLTQKSQDKEKRPMVAIAILDDYQNVALKLADWSKLQAAHKVTVFNEHLKDVETAAKALADFEVIGIMRERTPFPRAMFERLPKLKLLVTTAMRNASIDLQAAADHKVTVCGTPAGGHCTAELAFGLLIALARHFDVEFRNMREGRWQTTVGSDIRGKTLGLLGLGRLGGEMAKFGSAFGMKLIAWSQNLTPDRAKEAGAELVKKEDLFRRSDFVSVHLVLSDRSRGLVGAPELALMKPTACIINTSRGPIIDANALAAALKEKRIAGAALDVYDVEPLPANHPLRSEPRAVLTPHIGYVTEETYRAFYGGMAEVMQAWIAGKPIRVIGGHQP